MRKAQVYVNGRPAGIPTRCDNHSYTFAYERDYLLNSPCTWTTNSNIP